MNTQIINSSIVTILDKIVQACGTMLYVYTNNKEQYSYNFRQNISGLWNNVVYTNNKEHYSYNFREKKIILFFHDNNQILEESTPQIIKRYT